MIKPPLKSSRPHHVNYLQGFWLNLLKDCYKKLKGWAGKRDHTLTIKIRWVVAGLLLLALWPHPQKIVYGDPISPAPTVHKIKLVEKLPQTHLEATQTPLAPIPVYVPPPPPQPVYTAPVSSVANCGSDPMMAYIYTVESGCRTWAVNPGGCIGLGQACPGGKLPCGLYDWTCQDSWFRSYAVSAYGSIYNAYIFRQSHNWW